MIEVINVLASVWGGEFKSTHSVGRRENGKKKGRMRGSKNEKKDHNNYESVS